MSLFGNMHVPSSPLVTLLEVLGAMQVLATVGGQQRVGPHHGPLT